MMVAGMQLIGKTKTINPPKKEEGMVLIRGQKLN